MCSQLTRNTRCCSRLSSAFLLKTALEFKKIHCIVQLLRSILLLFSSVLSRHSRSFFHASINLQFFSPNLSVFLRFYRSPELKIQLAPKNPPTFGAQIFLNASEIKLSQTRLTIDQKVHLLLLLVLLPAPPIPFPFQIDYQGKKLFMLSLCNIFLTSLFLASFQIATHRSS